MNCINKIIAISSIPYKLLVAVIFLITPYSNAHAQEYNYDTLMREYGMVNITELDPEILVELKYSTEDNFVGKDMYGNLESAYLEKEFANRVVLAQKILKQRYPHYTLLIYDAARPISTQRAMRKCVEGTDLERLDGTPLNMGAGFDDFSIVASVKGTPDTSDPTTRTIAIYRNYINNLVTNGTISREAANNRLLLVEVMHEAGLYPYRREWWHYEDIMPMDSVRNQYILLDF